MTNEPHSKPSFLSLNDGHSIAYHKFVPSPNNNFPGVIFLGGFKSDMQGTKAIFLESLCKEKNIPYLRFDYLGHGESSGQFTEGTIGRWAEDALNVLDHLTEGPQLLIGSSMGGWVMLLTALARSERISGLIGIAPAPDFTENLIWEKLSEEEQSTLKSEGIYHLPNDYCNDPKEEPDPYPITLSLIEEARNHLLLTNRTININCPVHLIHGMQDKDVPYDMSLKLLNLLTSNDIHLTLVKNAEHRMSEPETLKTLEYTLEEMLSSF